MTKSESMKRAQLKYQKTGTVSLHMKLVKTTDADIIEHLEQVGNKQGYIKQLIREDMRKNG